MRFLIDASLPRATRATLEALGHEAEDVRDHGPVLALDPAIAAYARRERLCIVTADRDFADIRRYRTAEHAGIIVLRLPKGSTETVVLRMIATFVSQADLLAYVPGRLVMVSENRLRFRPAEGT